MKPNSSLGLKDRLRLWWLQRSSNPVQDIGLRGDRAAMDLEVLLRCGVVDLVSQETLLLVASRAGHAQLVGVLLGQSKQLDVNFRDSKGLSALHHAAIAASLPTLNVLLENGATVHLPDKLGRTPAHHAARVSASVATLRQQAYACIDALVAAGADLTSLDVYQETVLLAGGRVMGAHYASDARGGLARTR